MERYTQTDIDRTLKTIDSFIARCEKAQQKFEESSSHFSLQRNRIKALKIAKCLLENGETNSYSTDELEKSLPPINSIIHKTETARSKYEAGSTQYKRFTPTIDAMLIAKSFVEREIKRRKAENFD